jgi:hypothetical protein
MQIGLKNKRLHILKAFIFLVILGVYHIKS